MLTAEGSGLESSTFVHVSLDQIHVHRVHEKLVPVYACELDIYLILWSKIVEVQEHVQGTILNTAAKVHDVSVPCDLAISSSFCVIFEDLKLIFDCFSDPVVPLD